MKKVVYGIFMCAALVAFASCKKDKKVNCAESVKSFNEKATAYAGAQTIDNCNALKAAAEGLDESCLASLSTQFKEMIANLDCRPQ